jgi:hypothetical protein
MAPEIERESNDTNNHQFLSLAFAYLEIGKVAAKAETELKNDASYQNAIAYQLLHAVELFYKQMIKNKTGSVSHIHCLNKLEVEYTRLYPDPSHELNHPFDFSDYRTSESNSGEDALYAAHISKFKPNFMDQHLRYPSDEKTGRYSFDFADSVFQEIQSKMINIYKTSS